jgi:hypothetical protein
MRFLNWMEAAWRMGRETSVVVMIFRRPTT